MYPLNLNNAVSGGFAVANDEEEHAALSEAGYEPKFAVSEQETDEAGHTVESVRAALDAAGITYKKTFGLAKLVALLPA